MSIIRLIADLWQEIVYQWCIKQDGWHPDDIERHGG